MKSGTQELAIYHEHAKEMKQLGGGAWKTAPNHNDAGAIDVPKLADTMKPPQTMPLSEKRGFVTPAAAREDWADLDVEGSELPNQVFV